MSHTKNGLYVFICSTFELVNLKFPVDDIGQKIGLKLNVDGY